MTQPLEIVSDSGGSVVVGRVASDAVYLRFVGHLSTHLGVVASARLRELLRGARGAWCFCDTQAPRSIDFFARSAVVRTFISHRAELSSVTMLVGGEPGRATSRMIASVLGPIARATDDADEFDRLLVRVAPLAHEQLRQAERRMPPAIRLSPHGSLRSGPASSEALRTASASPRPRAR